MLNNISHSQIRQTLSTYQSYSLETTTVSSSNETNTQTSASDSITLRSESSLSVTYSGNMKMNDGDKAKYGMLQNLVANLLKEQGIDTKIAIGDSEIDIADITPEEAQELVSADGYFGVEQTSDRIFQFATGIAGGDPSRIEAIREGIDKGFAEAKAAFGDWLPEISYDTYDAVMKKLDDWVANSQAVA
ncbi:MAG: hypothetical protein JZU50_13715 [Desulfobulbaceae bacterium]|nr:hypothetical protein [Desulfobulbaceae bacterium]